MTLQPAMPDMPAAAPGSAIARYVADYHALSELMNVAVHTDFVPAHFRPRAFLPKNIDPNRATAEQWKKATDQAVASSTIGARFGVGLGLGGADGDPFLALSNVYVVSGKPSLYAESMVALVQDRGHDVWTDDLTDTRAVVCGRRKGSEHVERVTITMEQARKAGWTRNAKYRDEPQAMLYARAAARVCRRIAADAVKGFGRAAEELEDDELAASTSLAPGTRTVQRAAQRPALSPAADSASERPPLPGEARTVEQGAASVPSAAVPLDPIDEGQWRRINARFVELGVTGPGQQAARLYVLGRLVDRVVEKGSDLTAAEGDLVVSTLQGTTRERLKELLDERNRVEPGHGRQAETARSAAAAGDVDGFRAAGPPLPGEDDQAGDDLDQRDVEPGDDQGQPAALEGAPDPWGINS